MPTIASKAYARFHRYFVYYQCVFSLTFVYYYFQNYSGFYHYFLYMYVSPMYKGKGIYFLYRIKESHASSPLDRLKPFTLFALADLFSQCLCHTSSARHSSHAAITCNNYSLTFPLLSIIAWYSFIQLSGLGHCRENENAQTSKR